MRCYRPNCRWVAKRQDHPLWRLHSQWFSGRLPFWTDFILSRAVGNRVIGGKGGGDDCSPFSNLFHWIASNYYPPPFGFLAFYLFEWTSSWAGPSERKKVWGGGDKGDNQAPLCHNENNELLLARFQILPSALWRRKSFPFSALNCQWGLRL